MSQAQQLADRIREVTLTGDWIARTNCSDQLSDVNWQEAITEVASLNTIAALTFHINYYIQGLVEFLEGGELTIKDQFSFKMDPIRSAEAWKELVDSLRKHSEKFVELVAKLPDSQLEEVFVKEEYGDYRRNINAIIEHTYYHLGQISLIKKVIRTLAASHDHSHHDHSH